VNPEEEAERQFARDVLLLFGNTHDHAAERASAWFGFEKGVEYGRQDTRKKLDIWIEAQKNGKAAMANEAEAIGEEIKTAIATLGVTRQELEGWANRLLSFAKEVPSGSS
jgi:hypothetical protein